MNEINFATIITEKRRQKGITQEDLAEYVGITKASVSKWETGQSYPDITLLPLLAAYFDISIDNLLGYSPQMAEDDIGKLYERLASDFTKKPFEDVIAECEGIIKKYYSCYDLLFSIAVMYVNHAPMATDKERIDQIVSAALQLFKRVSDNCKDVDTVQAAVHLQATCYLALGDGAAVLELLGETINCNDIQSKGSLISQAFMLLGNEEKAQESLQFNLYNSLMENFQAHMVVLQGVLTK